MLMMAAGDPAGKERIAVLWVERDKNGRRVRFKWRVPGQAHDWFNIFGYDYAALPAKDRAPDGFLRYANTGDPGDTGTAEEGETSLPLDGVTSLTWSFLVEGCDPTYFLFIRTGHACKTNVMPRLWINVAEEPAQPFSCRAEKSQQPGPSEQNGEVGIVMEVGSCLPSSIYGLFVYVWTKPCDAFCPPGASNYGFAVVAPSRGWALEDFDTAVKAAMKAYRDEKGHGYAALEAQYLAVPISPPVVKGPNGTWVRTGLPSSHTVIFQWGAGGQFVFDDTGAPGFYSQLAAAPTAAGHISAPDLGFSGEFIRSSGSGCFTVAGLPTPADADPPGLVVDLRDLANPKVETRKTSALAGACS
jgi:hypothetical protein